VQIIHTPGQTWGSTAVYDPDSKTLIAGTAAMFTAILGQDSQPVMPPTYQHVDSYLATLERLSGMDIQTYSSSYWPLISGTDVKIFLEQSRVFCEHIEDLLLTTLQKAKSIQALQDLIMALKPTLGHWSQSEDWNLAYPFTGSLQRLVNRGLIRQGVTNTGLVGWSSATG
jgi:glyoxylase-like metal-dependent hydrolase (beta-lactamase superfamily II)